MTEARNNLSGVVIGNVLQIGSHDGPIVFGQPGFEIREAQLSSSIPTSHEARRAPSYLLDARRAVVPFVGRVAELNLLIEWINQEAAAAIQLVHASGGTGKTRLSAEFATRAREAGWQIVEVQESENVSVSGIDARTFTAQPTLAIVDYAERWNPSVLIRMISSLVSASGAQLRILVLSRPGESFWKHVRKDLPQGLTTSEPLALGDLAQGDQNFRGEIFRGAADAFLRYFDLEDHEPLSLPDEFSETHYARPLDIHMSALATVCARVYDEPLPKQENLSRYLLDHERRCWGDDNDDTMEQTVLMSTLFGPAGDLDAAWALLTEAGLADGNAAADRLIHQHERHYPYGSSAEEQLPLQPLRPDRFGEDFVGTALAEEPSRRRVERLLSRSSIASEGMQRRALAVLSASGMRHHAAAVAVVTALQQSSHLIQLSDASTVALIATRTSSEGARNFLARLPSERSARSEAAGRALLKLAQNISPSESDFEKLKAWLTAANHLHLAGATQDAVEPIRQAQEYVSRLDDKDVSDLPELRAFVEQSLSEILWDSQSKGGRHDSDVQLSDAVDPSRRAVEILEDLDRDGKLVNRARLGEALVQLGTSLAEGGGDAEEGLEHTREGLVILGETQQTTAEWLAKLGRARSNLVARLVQTSRAEEAYRESQLALADLRQVEERSSTQEWTHLLATALTNHAGAAILTGHAKEAVEAGAEAVEIRRRILRNTEVPMRDIARALGRLADAYENAGERHEAALASAEAITFLRKLVTAHPLPYSEVLLEEEQRLRKLRRKGPLPYGALADEHAIVSQLKDSPLIRTHAVTRRRYAIAAAHLGISAVDRSEPDDAIPYLDAAISVFEHQSEGGAHPDYEIHSASVAALARVNSDSVQSATLFERAISILSAHGDLAGNQTLRLQFIVLVWSASGVFSQAGRFVTGEGFVRDAIRICDEMAEHGDADVVDLYRIEAPLMARLSDILIRQNEISEAEYFYEQALDTSRKVVSSNTCSQNDLKVKEQILSQLVRIMRVRPDLRRENLADLCDEWVDTARAIATRDPKDINAIVRSGAESCLLLAGMSDRIEAAVMLGDEAVRAAEKQDISSELGLHELSQAYAYHAEALGTANHTQRFSDRLTQAHIKFRELFQKYGDKYRSDYLTVCYKRADAAIKAGDSKLSITILKEAKSAFPAHIPDSEFDVSEQILQLLSVSLTSRRKVIAGQKVARERERLLRTRKRS